MLMKDWRFSVGCSENMFGELAFPVFLGSVNKEVFYESKGMDSKLQTMKCPLRQLALRNNKLVKSEGLCWSDLRLGIST